MTSVARFLSRTSERAISLSADRRGNVMMILALAIMPLTICTGAAIDYAKAARLQTKLNAAADAAALAAVTQPMMTKSDAEAKAAAVNMFNEQAKGIAGLIYDPGKLTVTITAAAGATNSRTATVTYLAKSQNAFAGILGLDAVPIGGTSRANATVAPNIDFYLLLDVSSSMLLPATTAGLAAMVKATPKQGGCTFACHQSFRDRVSKNPDGSSNEIYENPKDPKDSTKVMDNYMLARSLNIELRTDLVKEAVSQLTHVAVDIAKDNNAKYRMGISSFDFDFYNVWPSVRGSDGTFMDADLTRVNNHVDDTEIRPYYFNNWRTPSLKDNDVGTATSKAFLKALDTMPVKPGNGTNNPGDTPQAVLFLVTDGMRDEKRPSGRPEGPIDLNYCTQVKDRGIRIAVLYTEYLPESASGTWSVNNVKTPYLSPTDKISPALKDCASPGLYYKVTTDGDITKAMTDLFRQAVATAHLIN